MKLGFAVHIGAPADHGADVIHLIVPAAAKAEIRGRRVDSAVEKGIAL